MQDYDPDAELYEICAIALREARTRPLTEEEITALRYAAAIPEGRAAARDSGEQMEMSEWH